MSNGRFGLIRKFLPIFCLALALFLFVYFRLYRYLSFEQLKQHRAFLFSWTKHHYFLAVGLYIIIYATLVAISVPGAAILTIVGGFLFGTLLGTLYVVCGATLGATILFVAAQTAFSDLFRARAGSFIKKVEKGFKKNAFNYLLFLRFIPLFPFFLVNIVPALLNVRLSTFVLATFFGIIPGSFVYASVGNGLEHIFSQGNTPDLTIIFQPQILLPIIGLAILSLLPTIYKQFKHKPHTRIDDRF